MLQALKRSPVRYMQEGADHCCSMQVLHLTKLYLARAIDVSLQWAPCIDGLGVHIMIMRNVEPIYPRGRRTHHHPAVAPGSFSSQKAVRESRRTLLILRLRCRFDLLMT